jgi:hypothetical protein
MTFCLSAGARGELRLPAPEVLSTQIVRPLGRELADERAAEIITLSVLDDVTAPLMVRKTPHPRPLQRLLSNLSNLQQHPQIGKVPFVYAQTLDGADLAASLAAALAQLPYFAGRLALADGEFSVKLTGGGAALTLARSRCALADLLPEGLDDLKSSFTSRNFPSTDFSYFYPATAPRLTTDCVNKDVPLVHAQATALAGGGTVLALASPHLLGDMSTHALLMIVWADEHRKIVAAAAAAAAKDGHASPMAALKAAAAAAGGAARMPPAGAAALEPYAAAALPPGWRSARYERRTAGFVPRLVGAALWQALRHPGGLEMVAYHVPAARLAELKAEATAGLPAGVPFISSNDALTAAVWRALAALPPKRAARARFFLSVNLRRRLAPPLPLEALGNLVVAEELGAGAAGLDAATAPLGALAAAVRAAVAGVDAAEVSRELRALAGARDGKRPVASVHRGAAELLKPGGPVVFSTWSWSAGYAEVAFGDSGGRAPGSPGARPPAWVQPAQARVGNTTFALPAPAALPGGGWLVYVTLHKRLAAALKAATPSL